jgi:hypothetical protein
VGLLLTPYTKHGEFTNHHGSTGNLSEDDKLLICLMIFKAAIVRIKVSYIASLLADHYRGPQQLWQDLYFLPEPPDLWDVLQRWKP